MASKHSKSFFDFIKCNCAAAPHIVGAEHAPLSLPFKIIIASLVLSLVLSMIFVANFFMQSNSHKKLLAEAEATFKSQNSDDALKMLAKENEDIKAWLKIDGTNVDCAVCQSDDNAFYINHNQLGKKSRYGALFLSQDDSFARKNADRNIVIFGNNMKDGSMFGSLKKYRNLNFYKQNPFVELYFDDQAQNYVVFSVMLLSSSADDNGDVYKPYKSHFSNQGEFDVWLKETTSRSLINTTVPAEYGDEFLTLVTVANDFDGARLVVMAKKISEWDKQHTDVSGAAVNAKIKYPKIWYATRGLEYPY